MQTKYKKLEVCLTKVLTKVKGCDLMKRSENYGKRADTFKKIINHKQHGAKHYLIALNVEKCGFAKTWIGCVSFQNMWWFVF